MLTILAAVFILLLALCALLNLASLPGNWVMAILVLLWGFFGPEPALNLYFYIAFFGLAVAGEVIEFITQIWGAKKYGSSNSSTFAGMIGAIAGAIFFAPFLFGIGAIAGALGGAWCGCFIAEKLFERKSTQDAATSANGALVGRFLGMTLKFGIGITMLVLTATHIWPA